MSKSVSSTHHALRTTHRSYDCVGIGICPSDYICLLDHYPRADEKTTALRFSHQGGGPVGTALSALATWGASAAIIGAVGDDDDGAFVRREFERAGVDTRFLRTITGARSACSFIWVDISTGRRTVVLDRTDMPVMRPRDLNANELPPCRVFHTDGRDTEACLKAMRHYRRAGAEVVLDAGSIRPRMEELIAATDHFVASHNFTKQYFGERVSAKTACRGLLSAGARAALITLGENGCVGATSDGDEFAIPGHYKKDFILDTTGAGDVFHGGYIYGLLRGWEAERRARFANAAAFLKCGSPGGREGIPRERQALAFMKTGRHN